MFFVFEIAQASNAPMDNASRACETRRGANRRELISQLMLQFELQDIVSCSMLHMLSNYRL